MQVYEDIIHVDRHVAFVDEVLKNVIHHCLEGVRAFGEAEEHHKGFKEAPIRSEGGLPLVSLLDLYVVVSPTYVQLGEVLCLGVRNSIDDIWFEGEWVGVLHCHHIELSVVLDESQFPIFLFHKEDWGRHWRLGRADLTTR